MTALIAIARSFTAFVVATAHLRILASKIDERIDTISPGDGCDLYHTQSGHRKHEGE
jgi:hypothetical protein